MKTRILHTIVRVGNVGHPIDFYTRVLGMTLLRKNDYPDGQSILVSVGYGNEADSAVIELTHNRGMDAYEIGTGYDHIATEVDGAYQACDDIRNNGDQVTREAGPMKYDTTVTASMADPDGCKIELI